MNPAKWIRWKYVAPLAIFIAAMMVFFMLFFDGILAHLIQKYGSKANGAKVEVTGLKTKFLQGRLSVQRLQVADPDADMQNRFEAGPMAFQLDLSELIGKRVIIKEATIKGLGFNTPRKTSGKLPVYVRKSKPSGPPSAAEKLAEKYKDRFKLNIDGIKGEAKERIKFDPKDLELTKSADGIKEKAKTLPDEWQKKVKDLNADARLKKAEDDLKAIKQTKTSGSEALTEIPAALKKLNAVKDDLNNLKKDTQQTRASIQDQSKALKSDVTGLSDAKKRDLDGLMARMNLDFASPERLMEGIIGPMVLKRFQTVLHYVQLARQHMPSKKEQESLPPTPRAKGMDIQFPTPGVPPRFWLVTAGLEGTFQNVNATGSMSDLTTDPPRVGRPFKLDLKGKHEAQTYAAGATFDHTQDVDKDSVVLQADGLDVKSLAAGTDNSGVSLTQGMANINMALNLIGEGGIGGQIHMGLTGLKIDGSALAGGDKIKMQFMDNVSRAIQSMKEVAIDAQVYGSWNDPNLKISSNLAGALGNVIKDSVGNMVKDQKKDLEDRLNQVLVSKQSEVNGLIGGLDSKVNGQLAGVDSQVEQKIAEATGINLGGGGGGPVPGVKIPSLDKFFKK